MMLKQGIYEKLRHFDIAGFRDAVNSHLQMVKDDSGAEEVVINTDEVRQLGVQHHTNPLFPQSQSLLLQTRSRNPTSLLN